MTRIRPIVWITALIATCLSVSSAPADEPSDPKPTSSDVSQPKPSPSDVRDESQQREAGSQPAVYVPPSRGAARVRLGAGTRGPVRTPDIAALAPDHVGLTTRAQPAFAWFVAEPTQVPVEFTLSEVAAVEPLLEVRLPGPFAAGIHLVGLDDYDIELETGRSYQWSIALVVDEQSRGLDAMSSGAVRREPQPSSGELPTDRPSYRALAERGIWYDAIADLSAAIAARAGDASLRAERAGLFEQAGLGAPARFERSGHVSE